MNDFHTRSQTYEPIPENATILGIFSDAVMVGYLCVTSYSDVEIEVNQGYLSKDARHVGVPQVVMGLFEQRAKAQGFKRVVLAANRDLKAYTRFMNGMGYMPSRVIFSKEL